MQAITPKIDKYNLRIKRGDTFSEALEFADELDTMPVTTEPVDFTGCTFLAQIRLRSDTPVLATMTINVLDAEDGSIELHLPASASATLPAIARCVWDLQVTFPGGFVRTMLEGIAEISADVSR